MAEKLGLLRSGKVQFDKNSPDDYEDPAYPFWYPDDGTAGCCETLLPVYQTTVLYPE
jgi:hypothetical protein